MQLLTTLAHLRGKRINVGGNDYDVDDKGVARNVSDADAAVLLESLGAWVLFGSQTPEPEPESKPEPEPETPKAKGVKAEAKDSATAKDIAVEEKIEGDGEDDDVLNQVGDLTGDLGGPSSGRKKKKG